eukprot:COSAG06_NODE_4875_length_3888_cov_11.473740_1_plen_49_part_10
MGLYRREGAATAHLGLDGALKHPRHVHRTAVAGRRLLRGGHRSEGLMHA